MLLGFQHLADNSGLGRSCGEISPKVFYFPLGKHVVYYTKEAGFILIVAILGQSQRPKNTLIGSDLTAD
ncbi:type II toxin-antitoxin system RelE/ParE family toxin [Marinomonas transparens]|uniref:type II toxin-antitoxin system RelE/ParE family toxin n=1 Tax=Marinomonas transparens TaxID=2795388 RepID=UPI0034DCF655